MKVWLVKVEEESDVVLGYMLDGSGPDYAVDTEIEAVCDSEEEAQRLIEVYNAMRVWDETDPRDDEPVRPYWRCCVVEKELNTLLRYTQETINEFQATR